MDEEVAVSLLGQRAPTPPPVSQQTFPLTRVCEGDSVMEGEHITSEELDKRMQEHLKIRATEW